MWVDEAGHQQERAQRRGVAGAAARVAVLEPGHHAVGDQRVAPDAGIGERGSVGFGADPAREAVRGEGIGVQVAAHRTVVDDAVVVVGGQGSSGFGVDQVGVRDVPFAVVVGVVAGRAEPVAEGGDLAGTQPA